MGGGAVHWVLGGMDPGTARALTAWNPEPGRHPLSLAEGAGNALETTAFAIRAARSDPQD